MAAAKPGSRSLTRCWRQRQRRSPGFLERLAGWFAGKALVSGAVRAATRGDWHESNHYAMALITLNTGKGHPAVCDLDQVLDMRSVSCSYSHHTQKGHGNE